MRDAEAQLIHDMQNTAMVLREAAGQLHEQHDSLPAATVAQLTAMLARRSDMLVRLLGDLSTSHLAGRNELDLSLQAVALPDICHDLVVDRQPRADGRITLDVAPDTVALADPMRITQVLDNLLTNALRYGGPDVRVAARRAGGTIRLSVSDNGSGVPEDVSDRLFDAYTHGAASHGLGGSGLGLRIVRQLCEAMNGTIEYAAGDRTTFTATFPAVPAPSVPLGPDAAGNGHSVAFSASDECLPEALIDYVGQGLVQGEAVVVAATAAHHELLESRLREIGLDPEAAIAAGQYVRIDAEALRVDLALMGHIDPERFDALVGETVRQLSRRWRGFRVFGEIVDLFWRRDEHHLALELETCWDGLRAQVAFPLLCGYTVVPGEQAREVCECHDAVVSA
jgi:two-component sensor histidine kinase